MLCREWGVAYVGGGKRGMCAWWGENAEHVTLLGTEMWKIRPKNKTKKKKRTSIRSASTTRCTAPSVAPGVALNASSRKRWPLSRSCRAMPA